MARRSDVGMAARVFAGFSALSLVPVLALGGLLAVQYRQEVERRGIAQAQAQAEVIARVLVETQLEGHSLDLPLSAGERRRLMAFSDAEVAAGTVTRLRLRAPDERVVFSDDGSGLGSDTDEDAREALAGTTVAEIGHLNSDAGDVGPVGGRVVEVYTALRAPAAAAPIGVLEIYLPYEGIAAELGVGLHRLYLVIALGLALLYVVLAALAGWTTRRLGRHAAQLQHLLTHDSLTALPNRVLFAERIQEAVDTVRQQGGGAAVVLVDLDRFREVNDTLGHHNGDRLLAGLADRLRAGLRPGETLARLGGDEFGLVLPGVAGPDRLDAALRPALAAIAEEVEVEGVPLSVEASLGVAFAPQDGDDPDLLMQHADVAVYVAKQRHGGVVRYDPTLDTYHPERLALVGELRRAVQRDELVLHYQPQMHEPDGDVRTLEALVRWQHPQRGLLPPDRFVPIAEQTGLIDDLTRWVLDAALARLREWRAVRPGLTVAVNISARSLQDLEFPALVLDALDRVGAGPDWLLLEITETALVADAERAAVVLGDLHRAGLRLSLDDFGQGYTSLGQLSELPLSELKIDKSFVLSMHDNPTDAAIVRSVIDLGHNLGMDVVAEGVEDAAALDLLRGLGCDVIQGFWLSRPLPADGVLEWIAAHDARRRVRPVPAQLHGR